MPVQQPYQQPVQQPVQPIQQPMQQPYQQPVQQPVQSVQQPYQQPVMQQAKAQKIFKTPKQLIIEFLAGFFAMWLILLTHSWATRSQFGGMIFDIQVALTVSLILSVILLLIYIILCIAFIFVWKRPAVVIGSLLGFPAIYMLSAGVREGFQIFNAFI